MTMPSLTAKTVPYIASIPHVKEVALWGSADLAFWREHLNRVGLFPYDDNGSAEVIISASALKYYGVRFRELTVAVSVVTREGAQEREAVYLAQAFNSSRWFAFAERAFFHTPYDYASVALEDRVPVSMSLYEDGATVFSASMASRRGASSTSHDALESPIFLPARSADTGNCFFARLSGVTETVAFAPEDNVVIRPSKTYEVLGWLVDSGFAGREWRLRADALHERSKTYPRAMLSSSR